MSNRAELVVARKNTIALINADPRTISLRRPTFVTSAAGGKIKGSPVTVSPQTFRIVPSSGQVWDRTKSTPDEGRVLDVTMMLIGRYDADIEQNDEFDWDEDGMAGYWKVIHVSPLRHYRTQATIEFVKLS